jgi:hypothetical protein
VLGCVVPFSIVWCTGKVFDLSGLILFMHCLLGCLGHHQRSVGVLFVRVGLIKNVTGGIHSQDGQQSAGQRWSDMNNIVRMVGGEAVVAPEDFPFMALRTSLSFIMAHSEGGLGIGIGALVRSCFLHVLLDGYGWLLHRSHLNLSGSGFHGRVLRARTARR